jgi:hypothetical protein
MGISRRFVFTVSILGATAVILATLTLRPVFLAISVRNDIAKISKGHFDEGQLRQWAARHHGVVTCHEGQCEGSVYIPNSLLHSLHLAPLTRFNAEVDIVDNRPVRSTLSISDVQYLGRASGATTMVVVEYESSRYSEPVGDLLVRDVPKGKLQFRLYAVTPQSSRQAIARAFKINVWCLARIGGCPQSQQAPDIWVLPPTPIRPFPTASSR